MDEIPVTKKGMEKYIYRLEIAIKPVQLQYDRMKKLLTESRLRLEKCK